MNEGYCDVMIVHWAIEEDWEEKEDKK